MTDIKEQSALLLGHAAGYVAHRTISMGQRTGLLAALTQPHTPDDLAVRLGLDPFYVSTWCRSAFAAGIVERHATGTPAAADAADDSYRLAAHMDTLLLDSDAPVFVGGVFGVLEQPEMFTRFEANLASGERLWWDGCGEGFIQAVSGTGRPFYRRLIPGGLDRIPGLPEALAGGCRVLDTACGSGSGLVLLAQAYPDCELVGVDGDAYSLELAEQHLRAAGLADRVTLHHSPLEKMDFDRPFRIVINNISMHECRDVDRVTANVHSALEPDGWFVISDFPFPDDDTALRSVPGRVMCGIQFFEAQIDDQLVPRAFYDDLLRRHGFAGIGNVALTPMHALTYGRRQP